jgi:hypothetical protein
LIIGADHRLVTDKMSVAPDFVSPIVCHPVAPHWRMANPMLYSGTVKRRRAPTWAVLLSGKCSCVTKWTDGISILSLTTRIALVKRILAISPALPAGLFVWLFQSRP